jgi:hypothetical protein
MANKIQYRRGLSTQWASVNPTLAAAEIGFETDTGKIKIGNGSTPWNSLAYGGGVGVTGATGPTGSTGSTGATGPTGIYFFNMIFGDGSDGAVTISSGTTTLTRDYYYTNLTINGTGKIAVNGWRVFCSGTLDLTAAGASAINANGGDGANAIGLTGGDVGAIVGYGSLGPSIIGSTGGDGGTGAGVQAAATGNSSPSQMSNDAAYWSGKGGTGASAGGARRGNGTAYYPRPLTAFTLNTVKDRKSVV